MAISGFDVALCHLVLFALAAIYRSGRDFAAKRLTPAELVGQVRHVRGLIARALQGKATREDVKDLAQDVLLAAWEASEQDRYRPDPDLQPSRALAIWLRKLAYHRIAHHLESARVRREEVVAEPPRVEREVLTPEQALEREEMRVAFLEALRQLPEQESAVVMAHDVYEMSMDDFAEQRDVPRSTAYRWRARGIDALTRALRPRRG
ncbi:sigma-70 family RNA polymerase sigma factor [Sorangium sp. So ce315]|uniref:RNA polymerase sigma factor n=1 Tax=Sorangium sp. So ce315 TaxID=3133299 RepID=UPI003F630CCA